MNFLNVLKCFVKKNDKKILTGIGIAGYAMTAYLSVSAYKETVKRIDEKAKEKGEPLTKKEIVKEVWGPWVKTAVAFSTSTLCILSVECKFMKEKASLIGLVKTSETALFELEKQTKEAVGEETFNKIKEKVTEKQMQQQTNIPKKTYLDDSRELYYDGEYGGYFYATELEIYKAFEETRSDIEWAKNTGLGKDFKEYVPLSNLYYRLHGEPIGIGDDFGYFVEEYRCNKFDYTISDEYKLAPNGKRALVIYYDKAVPV